MSQKILTAQALVAGKASGKILHSATALSFWGGVDPDNGCIIDQHHPLLGCSVTGKILAIPCSRGSSTASGVLLELLLNGHAPLALVFSEQEEILTLGVLVAAVIFNESIPVIRLNSQDFTLLGMASHAIIDNERVVISPSHQKQQTTTGSTENSPVNNAPASSQIQTERGLYTSTKPARETLQLTSCDEALLDGGRGQAAKLAMQIVSRMAAIQGASALIDVHQVHIDACVYNGPAGLLFANTLVELGAQVCVPTTLNSLSVDQRRWQQHGVDAQFGNAASELGNAFVSMGAQSTFTCAPYLLATAPQFGQQISWAESNAVVYANSVLGARTQKYADFLDVCMAITGRAPAIGCHLDAGRQPSLVIRVHPPSQLDDLYWPLMGYQAGLIAGFKLPIIHGLEETSPTSDDLKAFCAAFATTSATAMVHIAGITPEAASAEQYLHVDLATLPSETIDQELLLRCFYRLNTARQSRVDMICLGNPHFSITECATLALICKDRKKHEAVKVIVTLARDAFYHAETAGYIETLQAFGVEFITDTCWCMIRQPIIPDTATVLMTNSGKYAHYAPGLAGKSLYFDSLENCVQAAVDGTHDCKAPAWLEHIKA
ncbi:MAG: aconitase X [Granulosicoccus sp.]